MGGPKLIMGKMGVLLMSGHRLSPDPVYTANNHALSMNLGRAFPLLWRSEWEGLAWGKNVQEENLPKSKKWPHEQG